MNRHKNLAMCGLDCGACDAFIATKNNDNALREKTAKEWTERYCKDGRERPPIKPQDINCTGCLSRGLVYLYCRTCKVRLCGLKKKITNCKECARYKCKQLIKLQSLFI